MEGNGEIIVGFDHAAQLTRRYQVKVGKFDRFETQ